MAGNLTDAKLRNLSAPEAGQAEYPDEAVPGLRARIGRSGKVSFVVRKRFGKSVRVSEGKLVKVMRRDPSAAKDFDYIELGSVDWLAGSQ